MPHRFPPLAPQERNCKKNQSMARALPAPSITWVDAAIFAVIAVLMRLV